MIEGQLTGVTIAINSERPRKGVFEVRVGPTVIVSTGPEARPFPALKALDVAEVGQRAADDARARLHE